MATEREWIPHDVYQRVQRAESRSGTNHKPNGLRLLKFNNAEMDNLELRQKDFQEMDFQDANLSFSHLCQGR